MTLKDEPPGQQVFHTQLEKSREIAPEGMKRLSQSRSSAHFWMCLVMKAQSDGVKNNIAQEPGLLY